MARSRSRIALGSRAALDRRPRAPLATSRGARPRVISCSQSSIERGRGSRFSSFGAGMPAVGSSRRVPSRTSHRKKQRTLASLRPRVDGLRRRRAGSRARRAPGRRRRRDGSHVGPHVDRAARTSLRDRRAAYAERARARRARWRPEGRRSHPPRLRAAPRRRSPGPRFGNPRGRRGLEAPQGPFGEQLVLVALLELAATLSPPPRSTSRSRGGKSP